MKKVRSDIPTFEEPLFADAEVLGKNFLSPVSTIKRKRRLKRKGTVKSNGKVKRELFRQARVHLNENVLDENDTTEEDNASESEDDELSTTEEDELYLSEKRGSIEVDYIWNDCGRYRDFFQSRSKAKKPKKRSIIGKFRDLIRRVVVCDHFTRGILVAILINTLTMGVEYHQQVSSISQEIFLE